MASQKSKSSGASQAKAAAKKMIGRVAAKAGGVKKAAVAQAQKSVGRARAKLPAAAAPSSGPTRDAGGALPDATLREMAERAGERLKAAFEEVRTKATPAAKSAAESTKKFAVDLEGGLSEAFGKISEQAQDLMAKGEHTRVRIKFRGRQLAELPIAAVAAAEVASIWWFGPLRLLLGHVVGKAVLDVEFVSNADAHVAEGRAQLADGELALALAAFDLALKMDRRHAGAWLGRGVALKLRGDPAQARAAFEQAEQCDPHGESGREARRYLDKLDAK